MEANHVLSGTEALVPLLQALGLREEGGREASKRHV